MFALFIDGAFIRADETVQPLIGELTQYAQGTGFKLAEIKDVSGSTACGHVAYGRAGGAVRCAIIECQNYYMRHWTRDKGEPPVIKSGLCGPGRGRQAQHESCRVDWCKCPCHKRSKETHG